MESLVFEWNEQKNRKNIEKHGISFLIAAKIFEAPCALYASPRNNEERSVAVGVVAGKFIAVAFTERYEKIRIISARRARKKEEREYRSLFGRYAPRTH